jgi:hypothetical protein
VKDGEIEMGTRHDGGPTIDNVMLAAIAENTARAVARCPRCDDIAGEGEKCAECAKVRIARNQPQPTGMAELRKAGFGIRDSGSGRKETSPRWKSGVAPAAATVKEQGQEKQEAVEMKKYDCANPAKNPQCSGTCGKEGGLCRSCGIRAAKAAVTNVSKDPRTSRFQCASGCGETVKRDGAYCPGCAALKTGNQKLAPGGNRGSAEPGLVTMAVCDLVAAAARISNRVEASIVLEQRELSVSVKFALPN